MTDREKVIAGLEHCSTDAPCRGEKFRSCAYRNAYGDDCFRRITGDALALLKAQEPHIMTLEEVKECDYCWLEMEGVPGENVFSPVLWIPSDNEDDEVWFTNGRNCDYNCPTDTYNIDWRCWSSLPTDEQRKEVAWIEA